MRKEVYECDRCKVQVAIPRVTPGGAAPKAEDYAKDWRSMQFGPIGGQGPTFTAGTYCPSCASAIESVMSRADAEVLTPATDEDIQNAFTAGPRS